MFPRAFSRAMPARVLVGTVAAATLLATLTACAGSGSGNGPSGSDNRYIAGDGGAQFFTDRGKGPQAQGTTLEDRPLALSDYRGKVVVVNFWASWCAPCRAEAPSLAKIAQERQGQGVQFVGIDNKDNKAGALAFEKTFGTTYPSVFDPDGRVTLDFRVVPPSAIPTTLVLDRQGRVAARIIGQTSYSKLSPLIDKVVAEK